MPGEHVTPQSGGDARFAPTLQNKKPSNPAKSENEGIQEILARTRDTGWPHPSLCGEVGPEQRDHDERIQTGILTSGLSSLPPSRLLIHEQLSGIWEFVTCYSGATAPDSHRIP